jgi:general secretion pathway protein N
VNARAPGARGNPAFIGLGVLAGALAALLVFAPAQWMADALARATGERLLLAEARGTLWQGSAVLVLTGGPGSRDASALPGRLHWTLGLDGTALQLRARLACCLDDELALRVEPGLGRLRVSLPGRADAPARQLAQLPLAWLEGLGTPWNTIAPRGTMALASAGFVAESAAGRWRFSGRLEAELRGAASRLSTLPVLGDYRIGLVADAGGGARLELATRAGALQLSGSGAWAPALRFRGEARAAPGAEAALANLLNIIGRRQGAASLISIG